MKLWNIIACGAIAIFSAGCGGDDDSTPAGTGGGTGGDPDPTCENYCNTIMTNCTGTNAQYGDMTECINYCQNVGEWQAGDKGATAGNTIACRVYHGNAPASQDPAAHCPHAGPTGGNVCGSWCDNYCGLVQKQCTGANSLYNTNDECMMACSKFDASGQPGDAAGDTVQCRIYHSGVPASLSADMHCPHAGVDGGGVCVTDMMGFDFRTDPPSGYTRVDRMGMPAVSTVLATDKNAYNDANPADDATLKFAGELLTNLGALHTALDDDLQDLGLSPCSMMPSDPMNPMSLPGCVAQEVAPGVNVASLVIPDTLTLDTSQPSGFPNGRMLADPVIDVTLAVILLDLTKHGADTLAKVPVNPAMNDVAFGTTFPYLADPNTP